MKLSLPKILHITSLDLSDSSYPTFSKATTSKQVQRRRKKRIDIELILDLCIIGLLAISCGLLIYMFTILLSPL